MFFRTQDMANHLCLKEKFSLFKYTAPSISGHVTQLKELVLKMQNAIAGQEKKNLCGDVVLSAAKLQEFGADVSNGGNKFQV